MFGRGKKHRECFLYDVSITYTDLSGGTHTRTISASATDGAEAVRMVEASVGRVTIHSAYVSHVHPK